MPRITITYKTYTNNYPLFNEEEFFQLKAIFIADPSCNCLPKKNFSDFVYEFYNEFKLAIGASIAIGLIIYGFNTNEPFIICLPIIIWLLLGGFISIVNFIDSFNSYNNFYKKMKSEFVNFKTYEHYLYFIKFVGIKY